MYMFEYEHFNQKKIFLFLFYRKYGKMFETHDEYEQLMYSIQIALAISKCSTNHNGVMLMLKLNCTYIKCVFSIDCFIHTSTNYIENMQALFKKR